MRFWKAWIVTTKDFSVFRKNKYIFYSILAMPLMPQRLLADLTVLWAGSSKAGA